MMMDYFRFRGIGVSPGISIGEAFLTQRIVFSSRKELIEPNQVKGELFRLKKAFQRTEMQLTEIKNKDKLKDKLKTWSDKLEKLLGRIARDEAHERAAADALASLGGKGLYTVRRTTDRDIWYGHALPDLLNAWDFAFNLKRSRTEYEE